MYLKAAVAVLGIFAIAWLGHAVLRPAHVVYGTRAESIRLVPVELGAAHQISHWRNRQPGRGDLVETGAIYAGSMFVPAPVLLDFFRGADVQHNGIACFLIQGESLTQEHLMQLPTLTGFAVFDVGVVRTPGQIRLVAATECTARGCYADKLPFLGNFWHQWNWMNLVAGPVDGVVPAAVILTQKTDSQHEQQVITQLRAELARAVAQIDLTPARRLAAAQGG
ncbi:MAG: hypothetical protein KGK44_08975 [Gammaproteobacteria bacterium]|nr:hypothetical protein [Gammaproteobacteria bacterium]